MSIMAINEELAAIGLNNLGNVMHNLSPERLIEEAIRHNEGILTAYITQQIWGSSYEGRSSLPMKQLMIRLPGER